MQHPSARGIAPDESPQVLALVVFYSCSWLCLSVAVSWLPGFFMLNFINCDIDRLWVKLIRNGTLEVEVIVSDDGQHDVNVD